MVKTETKAEFGRGLTYCIGLFLKHYAQHIRFLEQNNLGGASSWFNAASDHLYDLDTSSLKGKLKKRVETWRDKCLQWGHCLLNPSATLDDREWAIQEAEEILREIDEKLLDTKTEEGNR